VSATNKGKVEQVVAQGQARRSARHAPLRRNEHRFRRALGSPIAPQALSPASIKTGKVVAKIASGIANEKEGELNTVTGAGSV